MITRRADWLFFRLSPEDFITLAEVAVLVFQSIELEDQPSCGP